MALLSSSNFSKNLLSVLLKKTNKTLLIIIVKVYSKIKYCIILFINSTIFKVYFIFSCSQSYIFDNWWAL